MDGDIEEAVRQYERVLEDWRRTQDRHDLVPTFLWQATFFGRNQLEKPCIERANVLSQLAAASGNPETVAALSHALGEVSLVAGKSSEAEERFAEAHRQAEKLEIPLERAVIAWRWGVALKQCQRAEQASQSLHAAYRAARRLGARPLAAWIQAELLASGEKIEEGRYPDPTARQNRGGLTRRQVEILRLLADGFTNKEIAAKLFISPRTVDMHVRNILDRLDCAGRTEAARKATALGLLA